jgi:hypothetical protein
LPGLDQTSKSLTHFLCVPKIATNITGFYMQVRSHVEYASRQYPASESNQRIASPYAYLSGGTAVVSRAHLQAEQTLLEPIIFRRSAPFDHDLRIKS